MHCQARGGRNESDFFSANHSKNSRTHFFHHVPCSENKIESRLAWLAWGGVFARS